MTSPAEGLREARVVRGLATAVVVAAALRLVVAIVAGIVDAAKSSDLGGPFPDPTYRVGDILLTLGNAGDGTGALLALAAVALLCWRTRLGDPAGETARTVVSWILALTALSAVAQGVGYGIVFARSSVQWSRLIASAGFASAYALLAAGALMAMRRLDVLSDERLWAGGDDDALVFAVDRDNGDVRAFFSFDEAARRMHVYSIEDNEFEFFTDAGIIVAASVQDGAVMLRPTEVNRSDELLGHLRRFVVRTGIHVDALDADDATAYAVPISDWQWLQLWPPWLRWIGMLVRRG